MKTKKLTDKQKLAKVIKTLKIYGNIDWWRFKEVYNWHINPDGDPFDGQRKSPVHTSLEVKGKDGDIKDGWKWAEETLKEIGQ